MEKPAHSTEGRATGARASGSPAMPANSRGVNRSMVTGAARRRGGGRPTSLGEDPAIDRQRVAGDHGGGGARQEHDGADDVLGVGEPAERRQLLDLADQGGMI